jgi:threonine 3-dehydrogenase
MKAVVKTGYAPGADFIEVPVPQIENDDEVIVKVKKAAICGTDVHIYQWNDWAAETVPKMFKRLPRIMGHEFCGEVIEIGKAVRKIKVGDRVAGETHIACGSCYLCRIGEEYNCLNMGRFRDGVFAEYAVIPEYGAEIIPVSIGDEEAALFEPMGVAVHALSSVKPAGEIIHIIGAGPIGLFTVVLAGVMGAAHIVVSDISEYRLKLALELGADSAVNPTNTQVYDEIMKITRSVGSDVMVETSGNVIAIQEGFRSLRKCGTCLMIGLPSEPLQLNAGADIVWKGAKIYGIHGRDNFRSWEIAKRLLENSKMDIRKIITHRFQFSEFEKAFKLCESGATGKVIFTVTK